MCLAARSAARAGPALGRVPGSACLGAQDLHTASPRGARAPARGRRPGLPPRCWLQALSSNNEGPDEQAAQQLSAPPARVFTGRKKTSYRPPVLGPANHRRTLYFRSASGWVSKTCTGPAPRVRGPHPSEGPAPRSRPRQGSSS